MDSRSQMKAVGLHHTVMMGIHAVREGVLCRNSPSLAVRSL